MINKKAFLFAFAIFIVLTLFGCKRDFTILEKSSSFSQDNIVLIGRIKFIPDVTRNGLFYSDLTDEEKKETSLLKISMQFLSGEDASSNNIVFTDDELEDKLIGFNVAFYNNDSPIISGDFFAIETTETSLSDSLLLFEIITTYKVKNSSRISMIRDYHLKIDKLSPNNIYYLGTINIFLGPGSYLKEYGKVNKNKISFIDVDSMEYTQDDIEDAKKWAKNYFGKNLDIIKAETEFFKSKYKSKHGI